MQGDLDDSRFNLVRSVQCPSPQKLQKLNLHHCVNTISVSKAMFPQTLHKNTNSFWHSGQPGGLVTKWHGWLFICLPFYSFPPGQKKALIASNNELLCHQHGSKQQRFLNHLDTVFCQLATRHAIFHVSVKCAMPTVRGPTSVQKHSNFSGNAALVIFPPINSQTWSRARTDFHIMSDSPFGMFCMLISSYGKNEI